MIQRTLMIFGPGGIGKSPLSSIIRRDVISVDPYRLRERPRDRAENGGDPDLFYAHRNLRSELHQAFALLGDHVETLSTEPVVEWFPKARTSFFDVRGEWQCLLLGSSEGRLAKAEIFGPTVPVLFRRQEIRSLFGELSIVILNPVEPLQTLKGDYRTLKEATEQNCRKARRTEKDVKKRVNSLDDPRVPEAPAWLAMLQLEGALEFPRWPFPEWAYESDRHSTLIEARRTLVQRSNALIPFLKAEDEILSQSATA